MTLAIHIIESDAKELFLKSIDGYRRANTDLDFAIENENWGAINRAQGSRDLHATTLALIVNKYAVSTDEEGARP